MVFIFFFFQNLGFLSSLTYLFAWFIFFLLFVLICFHHICSFRSILFNSPTLVQRAKLKRQINCTRGVFRLDFFNFIGFIVFIFFAARQFVRLDTLIFLFFLFCFVIICCIFRQTIVFCLFVYSFLLFSFLFLILFQMTAGMSRKSFRFPRKITSSMYISLNYASVNVYYNICNIY